jgi:uncharacterized protein with HEPN domain
MVQIVNGALLAIIEQAGMAILTLVEGQQRDELLRSRLTRGEVLRQLRTLVDSVGLVEPFLHSAMPELDWSGWNAVRHRLHGPAGDALDEALWFTCESLVPATLLWLRVYRRSHPDMFRMTA